MAFCFLKGYIIETGGNIVCSEIIGVLTKKVDCYHSHDDAVSQYDKRYEAWVKKNYPDYDANNITKACTLCKGDMMLLFVGKHSFMNEAIFNNTFLKDKVMVVFPAIKGANWYNYKNVFVINEDKE